MSRVQKFVTYAIYLNSKAPNAALGIRPPSSPRASIIRKFVKPPNGDICNTCAGYGDVIRGTMKVHLCRSVSGGTNAEVMIVQKAGKEDSSITVAPRRM